MFDTAMIGSEAATVYAEMLPWHQEAVASIGEGGGEAAMIEELERRRFHPRMYRRFEIPKKPGRPEAGTRSISAPGPDLMRCQYMLLEMLKKAHPTGSRAAHAYYAGRSIRTMAEPHVGKRWVVKMDLKDFFPSNTVRMVSRALRLRGIRLDLVPLISKWCFLDGGLPQGAPTSPLLSNITAAYFMDRRLLGLCGSWRMVSPTSRHLRVEPVEYTRYADDLCFSSDYRDLPHIIPVLRKIINSTGYRLNESKVRVASSRVRQAVCGVSLNVKVGKPRRWRRNLRAELHGIAMDIATGRCRPGTRLRDGKVVTVNRKSLRGRVEHVRFLCAEQGESLADQLRIVANLCRPPERWSLETKVWVEDVVNARSQEARPQDRGDLRGG